MFDNVQEPEDIFADVDPAKTQTETEAPLPAAPTAPVAPTPVAIEKAGPSKLLFVIIGVVVLGVLGGGGYWFLIMRPAPEAEIQPAATETTEPVTEPVTAPAEEPAAEPVEEPAEEPAEEPVEEPVEEPAEEPAAETPVDTDADGLTDPEELDLGTDPTNPDTDADGLTDREEVQIYQTNPLNPDTDADGYEDGQEVKGGYDPNGPGKLFEIPSQP